MASNKSFRFGPVALSNTLTTNILNPPTATGGVNAGSSAQYIILRHIRIVNKTASAATFSLWLGATGGNVAGTEVVGQGLSIAANSSYDWYGMMRLDAADFLVGGASAAVRLASIDCSKPDRRSMTARHSSSDVSTAELIRAMPALLTSASMGRSFSFIASALVGAATPIPGLNGQSGNLDRDPGKTAVLAVIAWHFLCCFPDPNVIATSITAHVPRATRI